MTKTEFMMIMPNNHTDHNASRTRHFNDTRDTPAPPTDVWAILTGTCLPPRAKSKGNRTGGKGRTANSKEEAIKGKGTPTVPNRPWGALMEGQFGNNNPTLT